MLRPQYMRRDTDRPGGPDQDFVEFYAAQAPCLLRTAWVLTGDAARAEELLQLVFVRAYGRWSRIDDPLACVRRMLVNANTDTWRSRRHERLEAEVPDEPVTDRGLADVDHRDELRRTLGDRSPRPRQVIVLRYLHGLSNEEISVDRRVSLGTVKSTLSRGLAELRRAAPFSAAALEGRSPWTTNWSTRRS